MYTLQTTLFISKLAGSKDTTDIQFIKQHIIPEENTHIGLDQLLSIKKLATTQQKRVDLAELIRDQLQENEINAL